METTRQEQAKEILNGKKFSFMGGTPKQNKLAKELFAERAAAAAASDMVFGKKNLTVEQGVDRVVDYFRHPADNKKLNSTQIITFFIGKF